MMNRLTINSYCWLFLLLLNTVWLQAQTNLPINQTTTISTLTSNDFQIPVGIESLTVEVRGADGGHARLDGGTCDVRVRGGQGATMKATFAIGNGSNELRPGGLLRVFAGRAGQTDESGCAPIPVGRYGAGGGSSAILYQAPGETSTRWDLLAVAGGGGGGARPIAGITDRTGKGGQAVGDGGDTSGSAGGKNGNCGSSSDNGYGGAGINCLGSDVTGYRMVEAIFGGSNGIAVELKDNSFATETGGKTGIQPIGGDGFTGGAVGAGGGGGGGGFSGGAGSSTWQGGGGGSYIAPNFSSTEVERLAGNQGGATNFPSQGFVRVTATLNCPTGEIQLNSQADVDNFPITYPNCTQISGQLVISGPDITDLSPLANITSIEGYLIIGFNATLADLQGLSNLQSVGGNFTVGINPALPSLNGLSALNNVGGDLIVTNNGLLADFTAICPLISTGTIGGTQDFANNAADFVVGECFCPAGEIQLNSQADVNNFPLSYPNCTQIPGQLVISGPDITDLSPLANITSIEGYLIIGFNATLADLQGLSNLQSVGGNLTVGLNPALPSLNGLSALNNVGGDLIVTNNGLLADFSGICPLISTGTIGGTQNFANNAAAFIASECLCPAGNISLNSQAEINNFPVNYPGCNQIFGDLNISGSDITDLSPLSSLVSVGGTLTVGLIPNLNNLQGLNNLQFVGGSLVLSELPVIQNLDALSNLSTVEGDLIVTNNGLLADFSGICPLISTGTIGGTQNFANNAAEFVTGECFCPAGDIELTSQAAVESFAATYPNCTELLGSLTITGNVTDVSPLNAITSIGGRLTIDNNPILSHIDGFDNLTSAGGGIFITNNPELTTGSAFGSLRDVIHVNFTNNAKLQDLRLFSSLESATELTVQGNALLTSLTGIENVEFSTITIALNEVLENVDALANQRTISSMIIAFNDVLGNVNGLANLTTVSNFIAVTDNPLLINFEGLCPLFTTGTIGTGGFLISDNGAEFDSAVDCACPLGDIVLTSQAAVESFAATYPNCKNLPGNLTIRGWEVLDLSPLSQLETIAGNLEINDVRSTAFALTNLVSIGGNLRIIAHRFIPILDGLSKLKTIGGSFVYFANSNGFVGSDDAALAGLNNLESVGGEFRIVESNMKSIIGFEKLTRIGERFTIAANPDLETVNAFGQLSEVGGRFLIYGNPLLGSFNPLSGLRQLGEVRIGDTQLSDLQVLSSLEGVKVMNIGDNPAMSSLSGLENLRAIEGVEIRNNNSLVNINALTNATLTVSTNSDDSFVSIIFNPVLTNINGLSGLRGTVGRLTIGVNDALVDIDALSNLSAITGRLVIQVNPSLAHLDGLRGLRSVGGDISIEVNAALSNFEGICPLISEGTIGGTLTIADNGAEFDSAVDCACFVDATPPVAQCKDIIVNLDANGQATVLPTDLDDGSFDDCGEVVVSFPNGVQQFDFGCDDVLTASIVIVEVTNAKGLSSTCFSEIGITEDIAPVVSCKDITVELNANGLGSYSADMLDDGVVDNCGLGQNSYPVIPVTCNEIGTFPVTYAVKDKAGNEGACTANVTVIEKVAPVALCQDLTVTLDEAGQANIAPTDIDNGSSDDCGTLNFTADQATFTSAQLGENTVTLTATDASGNSNSCTATVTVEASIALIAYVWDDQDGDGKQDANEPALAEASVELIDHVTGAVLQQTQTNVEGEAIFEVSGIEATQRVKLKFYEKANHRFTLKDKGSNDNIDSDASRSNGLTAAFTLDADGKTEKWDCGLWAPGTIQSFVWDDQDGDGKQDNGEPGLSGAQVDLIDNDGSVLATTTTDENGLANFSQVPANRPVQLRFYPLPNLSFTLRDQGSNNNIDSDASRSNGMTTTFQANKGSQSFESWDAGMWSTGTVQAYVWDDQDGDGKQDGGEPAIAGVRVDLLESDGAFIETAQTDASGIASFSGIPTNRPVKLQFFEKDDHRFTLKDRGSNDNIDSDASRTNGMTATFQPSMGNQTINKWDAGLWSPGQVKAYVWDDQDGDGKQDAAEPAVKGVEVKLLESDGALLATGQTDASGIVTFTDVPADRPVKLQFFEKADHRFTLKDQGSNNNIDSDASRTNGMTATFQASKGNQTTESWDAGLWSPGQVEAYVWDDRDGDGKQDAGEPGIKGVSVHLLESDGTLVQTGTTGAGGLVNFDNVAANRPFKLQFFTLPGFDFTLKDQGSNNNIDSDVSRSNGMTATFQASKGNQTTESWDAGLWSPGTVEAYVWDDLDGDGKQDEGEPAIANAKVDLLESDGTFMQTTTTNDNGIATFINVPADRAVKLQFFEPIDHRFTLKDKGSNDNIDSDASRSNGMTGTFQASQGGQVHTKMDCGLWSPGEVEAYVWNDLDGDGKQDAGEPGIEGVFVELLESNNDLLVSTATDADGIATILDVPANRAVKLQFTAPAGYSITLKDKGSNDNIDSDASRSNGRTATFQATMGQQLFVKWDAGLVEEGTSGARVVQEQLETPTAPVAVEEDLELEGAGLSLTAFPNPFSEQLTLEFYTSKAGPARIDVFNLQGQLVRNLFNGQLDAGQHQVQRWDGTGANAKSLPAGMYLIQMKTGEEIVNQKVFLQR